MNDVRFVIVLGLAVVAAMTVVRYAKQILALFLGSVVVLGIVGLVTVLSWCGAGPMAR